MLLMLLLRLLTKRLHHHDPSASNAQKVIDSTSTNDETIDSLESFEANSPNLETVVKSV